MDTSLSPPYSRTISQDAAARPLRTPWVLLAVYNLLFLFWSLFKPANPALCRIVDNLDSVIGPLAASVWALAVIRRTWQPGQGPSVCLALAAACYGVGETIWSWNVAVLHHPLPFPSWADAAFLLAYPFLFLGALGLPLRRLSTALRARVLLDSLISAVATATLSWYFVLGPTVLRGPETPLAATLGAAYPLCDLLLLFCLLRLSSGGDRGLLRLLTVALGGIVVSDTAFSYLTLHHAYGNGGVTDVGWTWGYMAVALVGALPARRAGGADAGNPTARDGVLWQTLLPYVLVPAAMGLFLYAHRAHSDEALVPGVTLGCAALIVLVLARQAHALHENSRLNRSLNAVVAQLEVRANQDGLTGLLNHRAFHQRLDEETDRAQRDNSRLAVAMLDLDNFKFFNDVYGHGVGDEVLQAVAQGLRGACRSYDAVARFGGDEFAVLMPGVGEATVAELTSRLTARLEALSYQPPGLGTAIPIGVSVGLAVFPTECPTRADVLETADTRLRQAKTDSDVQVLSEEICAGLAQSRQGFKMLHALVTAVDAKDRYTRRHSDDVLAYSVAMAQHLGWDAARLKEIQIAALLHDVGKIGVPDAILRKPGELTEAEFEAVKQHPMMGAIIVGAIPGFEASLDAIRHHHERWDGGGYPFGLRGEETPLPARVLAVADAFSAMTTDRPYRKGLPDEQATAILRDGAGSQWDPACVRAFLAAKALAPTGK